MRSLIALLLATLAASTFAQQSKIQMLRAPIDKQAFQMGAQSLNAFQSVVTERNFQQMGFLNLSEVKNARLGVPLPVFMVQLDDLRAYRSGIDPRKLLRDLDKVVFPVLVNGEVRSSVTVERRNDRWQASSFGAPRLARAFESARQANASANNLSPLAYAMVHVAALNRHYLAHRSGDQLLLTTIIDDPVLRLRSGRTLSAGQVFLALVPIARKHDGQPS
jgi:hypothetical protein